MDDPRSKNHGPAPAPRPAAPRLILQRQQFHASGLRFTLATEDVSAPTDWMLDEAQHTLVVHLSGRLRQMESVFSTGPSTDQLPSVGDVWAIPAGCRYAALARGGIVRFAEIQLPADSQDSTIDGHLPAGAGHRDPFLHQAVARAARFAERGDDLGRMALESLLTAIRIHIADQYLQPQPALSRPTRAFSERQRQRLIDCIAQDLAEPIRTEGLARVAGVPPSQFAERFRRSFGTTPWQYVLRQRIAQGRRLLEETSLSITAISATVGFSSPSHFATAFGQHMGATPSAYRQALRHG